jgi:outer membrane protein
VVALTHGHDKLTLLSLPTNLTEFIQQGIAMIANHLSSIALFSALASFAQICSAYDLQDALKDAVAIDPVTAASTAALRAAKEKVPQANALTLPTVNGTTTVNRQVVDTNLAPTRNFTTRNYGLNLSYPLYRAQNIETLEQSKLTVAIAESQLASAQQDLIVKVAQAYFDVLASQDSLSVIRAQKRAISEQLLQAKRNFEVGTATITDQQEAQAKFDLVLFQEIAGLNDLENKRSVLAILTGKTVKEIDTLKDGVVLSGPQPSAWVDWADAAKKNNYLVQQAQIAVENARREMAKQRLASRVTVDLVGSITRSENAIASSIGLLSNGALVGVQLNVPLYTGGAIESRIREAAANLNKSEFDLSNAQNQAELGARQAYLGLNSLINQVTALQAAEKSSRLALDSNQLGYQVGVRINIDVLNAQQQVFSTQRDLAKARYDVIVNGLKLKATAAALKPEDVAAVSALLMAPKPEVTAPTVPPAPTSSAAPATPPAAASPPAASSSTLSEKPAPVKQTRGGRSLKPIDPTSSPAKPAK